MNKPFLLIAGDNYYPDSGTEDWIATFTDYESAKNHLLKVSEKIFFTRGPKKGQLAKIDEYYKVVKDNLSRRIDWYEIVDLREWTQ